MGSRCSRTFKCGQLCDLRDAIQAGCNYRLYRIKAEILARDVGAPEIVRQEAIELVRFARMLDRVEAVMYDKPRRLSHAAKGGAR